MDYNIPDDEESSNSGVISTASGKSVEQVVPRSRRSMAGVILARNISKFFAAKLNPTEALANDASNNSNSIDVCAVLQDVDEILDHRSIEDGRLLLRGMVADLLKEMDVLRYKYDTLHDQYRNVKEERDVVNHEYNDRIYSLTVALNHAVSSISSKLNDAVIDETTMTLTNLLKEKVQSGQVLTADEATMMTIQTLTEKIAQLHMKNSEQLEQMMQLQERIDDLTSDNEAKVYKILALEKQFLNINTKRNKIVTKYNPEKKKPMMILRPLQIPDCRRTPVKEEVVDNKENIIANIILTPKNETAIREEALGNAEATAETMANLPAAEVTETMASDEAPNEIEFVEEDVAGKEDPLSKPLVSITTATPSLVDLAMAEPVPITPDSKAPHDEVTTRPENAAPVLRTQNAPARKLSKSGGHRVARLVKLVEQV
jgi:hypothetical protein